MTDLTAPVTPRTRAGRTLLRYGEDGTGNTLRDDILAIEREAAAPAATEALRELRDMHERLHELAWDECEVCGVIRAALASPEPTPEAPHVWFGDHGVATGGNVPEPTFRNVKDAGDGHGAIIVDPPDSGLDVERLERMNDSEIIRLEILIGNEGRKRTKARHARAQAHYDARLSSADSSEEPDCCSADNPHRDDEVRMGKHYRQYTVS